MEPHRVMIITGASGGLGRALALHLGQPGTALLIHYRTKKNVAEDLVRKLLIQGALSMAYAADVRSAPEVQMMIQAAVSQWGRVDLLIHSAGIRQDALMIRMKEAVWDAVIHTHLTGAFHCLSAVAEPMKAHGGGHVILLGSLGGLEGQIGQSNYAAAKAGLLGIMRTAARELGPWNVRVNMVLPGFKLTGMTQSLPLEIQKHLIEQNVLGRSSSINEVTGFIQWLSTTQNISGQVFNLDSRIYHS